MSDLNQINIALERLFNEEGHRIVFWNDPDQEPTAGGETGEPGANSETETPSAAWAGQRDDHHHLGR